MTEYQQHAIAEFQYAAQKHINEPSEGTRYCLGMAAAECELLGLDVSRITPAGYIPEAQS